MSIMHLLVPELEIDLFRVHMTHEDNQTEFYCRISLKDAQKLGLKKSDKIIIQTPHGQVIANPIIDQNVPTGILLIPYHCSATQIIGTSDNGFLMVGDYQIKAKIRIFNSKT